MPKNSNGNQSPKQAKANSNRQQRRTDPRFRRGKRRGYRRRVSRSYAPTAFGYSLTPYQRQYTTRSGAVHLRSREVFSVTWSEGDTLSFALPFCPCKWEHTRTSAIVNTFSTFRPLRTRITWQPTVGTNSSGTVTFGTVFAGTQLSFSNNEEASQSIMTTNGGFQTTVWKPYSRLIMLRTHLSRNNFPTSNIDPDDIPFWIVGSFTAQQEVGIRGHLIVESTLSLTNPVNSTTSPLPAKTFRMNLYKTEDDPPITEAQVIKTADLNLEVGQDVWFAPFKNVTGSGSQIINHILEPIFATVRSIDDKIHFQFPSEFAEQIVDMVMGGRPSNFQ